MAGEGRGGYRRPSNPAPTSGPGAHSRRTDGGQPVRVAPGGDYGDRQALEQLQQSAPLAQASQPVASGAGPSVDPLAAITGLDAASAMPDVPVTAGADAGAGPGMSALGLSPADGQAAQQADARALKPYIAAMIQASQRDDATPAFRRYVRRVVAQAQ